MPKTHIKRRMFNRKLDLSIKGCLGSKKTGKCTIPKCALLKIKLTIYYLVVLLMFFSQTSHKKPGFPQQ